MMKIIADSSANISALEGVCFQSIPMTIRAGEREFVDDGTLDTAKMLDYLASYNGKSGTACPGLDAWLQAFSGADEIFVVTITGALSGTCASAVAARDLYLQSHPEARIHVFDSLSTGPEMLLLIEKLADLIREGKSFDEICKAGQDYLASTHLLFILRSIHNLAQNGRVSKLAAGAVGILGIQILAKASEQGTIEPVENAAATKKPAMHWWTRCTASAIAAARCASTMQKTPRLPVRLPQRCATVSRGRRSRSAPAPAFAVTTPSAAA